MALNPTFTTDPALARIRVIASDMDGTLLDDAGALPPGIDELIEALARAGITFCPASSRPRYVLERLFSAHRGHLGIIADNGADVSWAGRTLSRAELARDTWSDVLARARKAPVTSVPLLGSFGATYAPQSGRAHDAVLSSYYDAPTYTDNLTRVDAPIDKVTFYCPDGDAARLRDTLRPALEDALSITTAGVAWLDVMAADVTKATGLAAICDHLGIDLADAAAFGDGENDVQMLATVGHGFAMANAEPSAQASARFVAPSNSEHGVTQVMRAILDARRGTAS